MVLVQSEVSIPCSCLRSCGQDSARPCVWRLGNEGACGIDLDEGGQCTLTFSCHVVLMESASDVM